MPPVSHKPGRCETSPDGDTRFRTEPPSRGASGTLEWDFGARPELNLRLPVYNIRYATGTGPAFHLPVPGAGYLRSNRKVLAGITDFIRAEHPDVVGLIEVDTGSIRTGMVNQAEHIAGQLGHYSTYQCKYGTGSINNLMPIVRGGDVADPGRDSNFGVRCARAP